MQHDDPFENSSYCTTDSRIPWFGVGAAVVLIATVTWMAGPDRASHARLDSADSATTYARDQAVQTMSMMGYHSLTALTQDAAGTWHAEGQKNGGDWGIEVSPQGVVSVRMRGADTPVPARLAE